MEIIQTNMGPIAKQRLYVEDTKIKPPEQIREVDQNEAVAHQYDGPEELTCDIRGSAYGDREVKFYLF